MAVKRTKKMSWFISIGFHILLIGLLVFSLEKTIFIPANPAPHAQPPIIDAVMVNSKALQQEKERLKAIEQRKIDQEREREAAIVKKEKEAKEKRLKEEAQLAELKQQKLLQEKQMQEQEAKIKSEQVALKKLQQEKEQAVKEQKKLEAERKAQAAREEEAKIAEAKAAETMAEEPSPNPPGPTVKVKQDAITQYAMLIRNKIHQNWRQPIGMDIKGFKCKVSVRLLPTGEVLEALIVQSSGSLEFDRSTEVAVRKASPLPLPDDPEIAKEFKQFSFTFHPEAA